MLHTFNNLKIMKAFQFCQMEDKYYDSILHIILIFFSSPHYFINLYKKIIDI